MLAIILSFHLVLLFILNERLNVHGVASPFLATENEE